MDLEAELNFLPDDYVAARSRARANRLCGALLAIVILSVAGAFAYAEASLAQLRAEHERVSADFDREAARIGRLDALQRQQHAVARRAELAEALIEKASRTALLGELTELLPESTSLSEVVMSSKVRVAQRTPEQLLAERQAGPRAAALAEPEPKRYDVSIRIAGLAYTDVQVALFINRLARSAHFDDVNLLVSREHTHEGQLVRRFEVEAAVREVPLVPRPPADPAQASSLN